MRISRQWLSDYVDFEDLNTSDFEELITVKVAEVEGVEEIGTPLASALLGVVKKLEPHPQKSQLQIAQVGLGTAEVMVVCGAPNVALNSMVAYIPPGGEMRSAQGAAIQVGERDFHGVKSCGVLVSESELGIGSSSSGLLLLDPKEKGKPGDKLASVLGGVDTVLVVDNKSLTHRPDLWSHFGFAREIAAVLGRPLKRSLDSWADDSEAGKKLLENLGSGRARLSVKVARESGCRRFAGLELQAVQCVESPLWLRRRLFAVGAGIRNILVDASNYVMLDVGQPNHAYDAEKLSGSTVFVRRAREGEAFAALDGETRKLSAEDIVIADDQGVIALGGVMGGGPSAVSETTTRLFLESANFDPTQVRLTTKRHALRTDASNRFEKSLSAFQVPLALHRFVELLKQTQGSVEVKGSVCDDFPERPASVQVAYSPAHIRTRLGAEISDAEISKILTSVHLAPKGSGKSATVDVPYYRATKDVSIPEDLVEEVGRLYGYSNIPERAPLVPSVPPQPNLLKNFEYRLADIVFGAGFSEVQAHSFVDPEFSESVGYSKDEMFFMQNPVDATLGALRTSLVPGLIEFGQRNSRFQSSMALFELGRGYSKFPTPAHKDLKHKLALQNLAGHERRLMGLLYVSGQQENPALESSEPGSAGSDFYAVTTLLRRMVRLVTEKPLELKRLEKVGASENSDSFDVLRKWMHPQRAAQVVLNGKSCGVLAEVDRFRFPELSSRAVILEIDVEILLEADDSVAVFRPLPKFPDSFFEMSVVMPKRSQYSVLEKFLRNHVDQSLLRRIEVLTTYEGAPLKESEKSVSVKLFLGAADRTLSREELTSIQEALMAAVRSNSQDSFALRG